MQHFSNQIPILLTKQIIFRPRKLNVQFLSGETHFIIAIVGPSLSNAEVVKR